MSSLKQNLVIIASAVTALCLGALFLVPDPYTKFALLLVGVFGVYLAWSRSR